MLGGACNLDLLRTRQKWLDTSCRMWLNRCRVKYHLRPKDECSNPVFCAIKSEYKCAKQWCPERDTPWDREQYSNLQKVASERSRFAMHAFDLKEEREYKESGRRLFELEKELENQK